MGFVLRHAIDEFATTLKQTFDDKIIQRSQIAYWILLVGNTLKSQHILKRSSGAFLSIFPAIPIIQSNVNITRNIVANRKYFVLPETIYDFNNDRAIDYITPLSGRGKALSPQFVSGTFNRTTPKEAERMYYSRYEIPSPQKPAFYRVASNIYILGLERVDVKFVEVGLFTAFDPLTKIDINAYFDFPDELMSVLRRQVLDLAKYSYIYPQDRSNDGADNVADKTVNTPKVQSVNDQSLQQPD